MIQNARDTLFNSMRPGRVYRRKELEAFSNSVARDVDKLVSEGRVVKAAPGLYYVPKSSSFGPVPASDEELVRAFLNDGEFLFVSFNNYNLLGLGLTQLYNHQLVYNRKRLGDFVLGGRTFSFRRPRNFPTKLTKEFLYVDLLNNLEEISGNTSELEMKVSSRIRELNKSSLSRAVKRYGKLSTQRFFEQALAA